MLKNLIFFSGFTLFVVAAWVGLGIYHNTTTSTISQTTNIRVLPIAPSFDKDTIDELRKRKMIIVNLREDAIIPSIIPDNQSTQSATPTPISITPGGDGI